MGVVAVHATQEKLDTRHAREATRNAGTPPWLIAAARAAGYQDVGSCHVERVKCPPDEDARVPKPSHETRPGASFTGAS